MRKTLTLLCGALIALALLSTAPAFAQTWLNPKTGKWIGSRADPKSLEAIGKYQKERVRPPPANTDRRIRRR